MGLINIAHLGLRLRTYWSLDVRTMIGEGREEGRDVCGEVIDGITDGRRDDRFVHEVVHVLCKVDRLV